MDVEIRTAGRDVVAAGRRLWDDLRASVARAVVGAEEPIRLVAIALLADGHVLLEDVPGTGKTLLARAIARSLDLGMARVQGTPDLLPSDVTGSSLFEARRAPVRRGPGVHEPAPRRRDQPRHAADPERAARGDAGAPGAPSRGRPTACPTRSSSSRPRTRSSSRGRSRCPRRSSTGSSSGPDRLSRRAGRAPDRAPPPGGGRPARRDRARHRDATGCSTCATSSGPSASPTRSRRTPSTSSARRATHPDVELGASPRATVALYRTAQAAAVLGGRDVRDARRRQGGRAGRPRPTGWSSTSTGACAARPPAARSTEVLTRRRSRRSPRPEPIRPARVLAAVVLILLGEPARRPDRDPAGTVALLLELVHYAWARNGLAGVRYRRVLGARHVAFGDELPLSIEVWNRRRLPLAWLRADDDASPGVEVRERDLVTDEAKPAVLRNAWTLAAVRARRAPVPRQRGPAWRAHAGPGGALGRRPVRAAGRDRGAGTTWTRSSSGRG